MSFLRGFSSVFAEFVNQRENKNGIYLYVLGLLFMISVLCSIHPIQWCQKQIKGGRARLIKILTSQKKEGLLVNRPPPPPRFDTYAIKPATKSVDVPPQL